MKKSLLISASLLALGVVTGIYAQTTGVTSTVLDKMKAVAHSFTLSATLNPTDTGLTSDPVKGKKTGDILTAGEYNRILELLSESGGGGAGWTNVSLTDTADFDTTCLYEVQFKTTDATNNNLMNGNTSWRTGMIKGSKYLGFAFTDGSGTTYSVWGIQSSNKNVYGYRDVSGTFFPQNDVSVLGIRKMCGGGAASSGGLSLYKCTNAQSLDTANTPCYGASRNGGAGTNQYRVVSCTDNDGTRSYTMSSILNFGQLVANKWAVSVNGGTIECDDGTVLVMDVQGGGSGGSAGWENVSQTDNTPFDKTCEYRFYMNAMGLDAVYYINVVAPTMLVYISHSSVVSSIPSDNKISYQVNGSPVYTVSKIEKRCN